jgi:uncharacterized membrane protein
MNKCESVFWVLLAVVLAFVGTATAEDGPDVTFRFKTVVVPKALQTSIYGINNNGAMVGYYINEMGAIHGLLLATGEVTNIDDPNSAFGTEALNANSNGTIVGEYITDSEGDVAGFIYENGLFRDVIPVNLVPNTGCLESFASGINDSGEIVGNCNLDGVVHGYLWNGEKYIFLDYPGANNFTLAWGINNAGLVTLQWIDSNGNYEGATYNSVTQEYSAPINVPGAAQTFIHSINNAGDIVFSSYDASGNSYGAVMIGQEFYTFSDPRGPNYTRPDGINDALDIVGRYEVTGGKFEKGFQATIKNGKGGGDQRLLGNGSPVSGAVGVAKSTPTLHPTSSRVSAEN